MLKSRQNRFEEWYNIYVEKFLPRYALLPLITCFLWNCIVYWFSMLVTGSFPHHDLTTSFDMAVPFRSEWVSIYILSFPFWALSYILTARGTDRSFFFRFVTADIISRLVCGVIFFLFPTTNVRPEVAEGGFWNFVMAFIYFVDEPTNLFPSIHCLVSMMSWLGVRKADNLSKTYKAGTLVFAVLIFASTQLTKQHYILDVLGGIAVALACYAFSMRTDIYKAFMGVFDKAERRLFCSEN